MNAPTPASLIFLVGYRGTGKSTVGRLVAGRLGWDFRDADAEIEAVAGTTIADIFAAEGEAGFRDREARVLGELAAADRRVLATGGGVVLRPANRDVLRTGFVAWLTAPADVLWDRLCWDPTTAARRPNLTASGGLDEVAKLLAVREPLYREVAAITIDTAARSPDMVAADILAAWESWAAGSSGK